MSARYSIRRHVALGFAALGLLLGGLGIWSVSVTISGAVVAGGQVMVASNRQVVQHPDGGVVGEILVADGDMVEAGQVLIRFDATLQRSRLAVLEGQINEILARRARLEAERDGLDALNLPPELADRADEPAIARLIAGQASLFQARATSLAGERAQLAERITQIENQIAGASAQRVALQTQLDLLQPELRDQQDLLSRGLTQAATVSALQREAARLAGSIGEIDASIAESRGRIAEIELDSLRLGSRFREEAITTLRDLDYSEIELRESRLSLLETLSRLDLRAPRAGIVYGLTVYAIRAVVQGAEPILYIIPQDSPLVIAARIPLIDIDQVYVGQQARLRFAAFDLRNTPELLGQITRISPDSLVDERGGFSYYAAELSLLPGELAKLGERQTLLPGMPVEAFIATRERTPLNYLVKPMADYFNRAFRED
ncbi:HlyD family type I secretion periplasmic adaptor subunit [Abyssibius alkaniclasticus]|uniref:HlyD family type I secretion periplasmic adaptor subunit n=1 Tax=Abyssibius alkaniclasticus TaxID=2881234 RepID=UPI0023635250|nr:HlyD family type I secretion periplasmic adaptor subunit [Abyssibius alkaniclasticus]UPH71898.1 HlyD family type I secretion periplasmic adaptor subunit [Abyssibius alkaniclasticus]